VSLASSLTIFSVNHAHLTVVVSTADHIPTLLKLAPQTPCLKLVISIDTLPTEASTVLREWAQSQGQRFMELRECKAMLAV
jgi:long-chain acyl-CoA synthetase